MATITLEPRSYTYSYGGLPAQFTVDPGDTIVACTRDAAGLDEHNEMLPAAMRPAADGFEWLSSNPCVGPVAVRGAAPGDVLAVKIDGIRLNRATAWSSQGPGMGSLTGEVPGRRLLLNPPLPKQSFTWHLDPARGTARLELAHSRLQAAEIPLDPFLGSIGVAPRYGRVETTLAPGEFGGNLDCLETRVGTLLLLPVWVRGGLLCFGDVHAAQGDGELCRSALETTAEVTLTLHLLKDWPMAWPRLVDDEWLMVAGSSRPLMEALQLAQVELHEWLVTDYGFDPQEAWQLNSQVGRMRIGNVVDPSFTVISKFPRRYLPQTQERFAVLE